jgi:hypothetical protein
MLKSRHVAKEPVQAVAMSDCTPGLMKMVSSGVMRSMGQWRC